MSDPRVFFAAERTLLAWVRSGLTVMALGFVVARFGLFLTVLGASNMASEISQRTHRGSNVLGITLVILGAAAIMVALYNHRIYVRSLPAEDVPALPMPWFTSFLSWSLAVIGLVLAAYLAVA
jgi:putative membrane protein